MRISDWSSDVCSSDLAGQPRMGKLVSEGARIFRETVADEDQKLAFQRELVEWLWASRDEALDLHDWLDEMRRELIAPRVQKSRSLHDDYDLLQIGRASCRERVCKYV